MPKRTIYVRDEDEPMFKRLADEGTLSSVIAKAVKAYVAASGEIPEVPEGMKVIRRFVPHRTIQFVGRKIWPPDRDDLDESWFHMPGHPLIERLSSMEEEMIVQDIYLTRKGQLLEYYQPGPDYEPCHRVYKDVADYRDRNQLPLDDALLGWISNETGEHFVEVLDI